MVLPLDPAASGQVNGVTPTTDRTNEVGAMKKWYSSVSAMLVMALAVQLTGCASTSRTFARWTGRDQDDQQVAEIDGKAAKDTAAKGRPEAKRPVAAQASKSKTKSDKPETADDERIVAKKVDPKAEKSEAVKASASRSATASRDKAMVNSKPAADSKIAATAKTEDVKRPATTKGDPLAKVDKADRAEASMKTASVAKPVEPKASASTKSVTAPKSERPVDPFAEFDVAADDSIVPPLTSNRTPKFTPVKTASAVKRDVPEVDPDFEELASAQSDKKIQEVAHHGVEKDLPEWATENASVKPEAKAAPKAERPAIEPESPTAEAIASVTMKPAVTVSPAAKTASPKTAQAPVVKKESMTALCPEARGEVRELVRTLDSDDLEAVKRSIHRLGRLQADAEAATPALEKLLLHRDGFVRVHSALALVRMHEVTPFVTETLILGLRSPDPSVRSFAAAVLAEMGPGSAEALPALSTALRDDDGFVRLHVAEVMIRHEDYSQVALDTLIKCLRDHDENVRWLATYSLAELAPQAFDATAALERSLSDPSPKVCVGAAYALGEIGPMARSATSTLKRCANSSDPELQAAVAYALRQVAE